MDVTVGDLRKEIQGLPDDTVISPRWVNPGTIRDDDPMVELCWFETRRDRRGVAFLVACVDLIRSDDDLGEDEDEDGDARGAE